MGVQEGGEAKEGGGVAAVVTQVHGSHLGRGLNDGTTHGASHQLLQQLHKGLRQVRQTACQSRARGPPQEVPMQHHDNMQHHDHM